MIISSNLQSAVKCLKEAEKSAGDWIASGIIELDFGFINYRQALLRPSHRYVEKARRLLKDDCGLF